MQVKQLVAPTQLLQLGIEQAWHAPWVEYWPAVHAAQTLFDKPKPGWQRWQMAPLVQKRQPAMQAVQVLEAR